MVLAITWTGCSGRGAATGGRWGSKLTGGGALPCREAVVVLAITWTGCSGRGAATGGGWGGKLSRGFVLTVPGAAEVLAITWTGSLRPGPVTGAVLGVKGSGFRFASVKHGPAIMLVSVAKRLAV